MKGKCVMEFDERYMTSFTLNQHPAASSFVKSKWKESYFIILRFLLLNTDNTIYVQKRVKEYQELLNCTEVCDDINLEIEKAIKRIWSSIIILGINKLRTCLILDVVKVLVKREKVEDAVNILEKYLPAAEAVKVQNTVNNIFSGKLCSKQLWIQSTLKEIKENREFLNKELITILVTANMSAGKSTLINSLVGKEILPVSQECCTGNIVYVYEKAVGDGRITIANQEINFNANKKELHDLSWDDTNSIFCSIPEHVELPYRWCLIDTPGVNDAKTQSHRDRAREAIMKKKYDKLLYIFHRSESTEEMEHLKWIINHVDSSKIIFILNKVDNYNAREDSVTESIQHIKDDLKKLGVAEPVICPVSAYFGLLLKKKQSHQILTEDEQDEYNFLSKKFIKKEYDLSQYYPKQTQYRSDENNIKKLGSSCGLYGLEKRLSER